MTVLGAISNKRKDFLYTIARKTNKETVLEFIEEHAETIKGMHRPVMVLDNHPSHWAHVVRDKVAEVNLELVFLPANSSSLNPQETVWATIKHQWRNHITLKEGDVDQGAVWSELKHVIDSCCIDVSKYWTSRVSGYLQALNEKEG